MTGMTTGFPENHSPNNPQTVRQPLINGARMATGFTVTDKPPLNNSGSISPPPINLASKPKPTDTPVAGILGNSQHPETQATGSSGRRLVAVYVDADRLGELEEMLRHLDPPLLLARNLPLNPPDLLLKVGTQNNELRDSDQSSGFEDFTASMSHMSLSENQLENTKPQDLCPVNLFPPRSVVPNNPSGIVSAGKKRYYSITVGKCTGVYWDTW
jgi:hypothetical protein